MKDKIKTDAGAMTPKPSPLPCDKRTAFGTIAILYRALTKDAWEKGPSPSEAIDYAKDWYYNEFGYEKDGDVGLKNLGRRTSSSPRLLAANAELREALEMLYQETADYITINKLGDVHHNQSMKLARAALEKSDELKGEL